MRWSISLSFLPLLWQVRRFQRRSLDQVAADLDQAAEHARKRVQCSARMLKRARLREEDDPLSNHRHECRLPIADVKHIILPDDARAA